MALEIEVDPSPLPLLVQGQSLRVVIRFKGARVGVRVHVELDGVSSLSGKNNIDAVATLATSYHPTLILPVLATRDGAPIIRVSSPDNSFDEFTVPFTPPPIVEAQLEEKVEMSDPTPTSPDGTPEAQLEEKVEMSDPSTTRPQGTPVQPRSWLPAIAGAAAFFAIFGGLAWWFHHSNKTDTEPVAEVIDEDNDPATMTDAEVEEQDGEQEADPEPVAVSEPEPTSEPVTPSAAPVVASPAPAAAPAVDPTNCTFVNGNRPMVGDKYVLTCAQGEYIAKGEYLGGGVFAFSAYEPHTP